MIKDIMKMIIASYITGNERNDYQNHLNRKG